MVLRQWRNEDVAEYARICSDPEVMRYMFPARPMTAAEAAQDVQRVREHWDRLGFGHWAVEERETGRFVGRTGLKRHPDWTLDPENTECGWFYAREVWGRGYATEGARAAVRFAVEDLGRPEVISITRAENAASRRVMEKIGFSYAGARRWEARDIDVVWYSLRGEQAAATG